MLREADTARVAGMLTVAAVRYFMVKFSRGKVIAFDLGEALNFSVQALRATPVRTLLTALGMVIGNASVILVVTISLTSREPSARIIRFVDFMIR